MGKAIVEQVKKAAPSFLSTFHGTEAVFDGELAPEGADFPFCLVSGPIADFPQNTKTTRMRDSVYDIRLYALDRGERHDLIVAIEAIRANFDQRGGLIVEGRSVLETQVTGPVALPSGDGVQGMGVTVSVTNEEG